MVIYYYYYYKVVITAPSSVDETIDDDAGLRSYDEINYNIIPNEPHPHLPAEGFTRRHRNRRCDIAGTTIVYMNVLYYIDIIYIISCVCVYTARFPVIIIIVSGGIRALVDRIYYHT